MTGICVDLGASGSRITGANGIIDTLPNDLVFVDRTEAVDIDVTLSNTDKYLDFCSAADILIEKTSGEQNNAFPARVLMGSLAHRYASSTLKPSVMANKAKQKINHVNLLVAVAEQLYVRNVDPSNVTIYVALPPLEVTKDVKDALNLMLAGTYKIVLNKLNASFDVNIVSVKCYPESYMALAAFFFDFPTCAFNAEHASKYGNGYTLSLDIGASTTDAYIAENMVPQEQTGQTIKTGGNIIELGVANGIRQKYGYDATNEILSSAVREGRLLYGNGYVDITDILRKAKRDFARAILNDLQSYFRLVNVPLQAIQTIVVSGGGSLPSYYVDANGKTVVTCEPVSEFITKELLNILEEGTTINVVPMDDARTANVRGLYVRYMMDMANQA